MCQIIKWEQNTIFNHSESDEFSIKKSSETQTTKLRFLTARLQKISKKLISYQKSAKELATRKVFCKIETE